MNENLDTIPCVEINKNIIAPEYLFDAWYDTCSTVLEIEPLRKTTEIDIASKSYLLDRLFFNRVSWNDIKYKRSQRYIQQGDSDYIVIQVYFSGAMQGETENNLLNLNSNYIVVQDLAHSYMGITDKCENIGVIIPRELIKAESKIYLNKKPIYFPIESSSGRILFNNIMTIWDTLPFTKRENAPMIANGFIGLVNGLLDFKIDEADIHDQKQATLRAIKKYISNNLTIKKLSREDICQSFNISNSTLTRLFKEEGGLRSFIQNKKLIRCFNELLISKADKQMISLIAIKYGFYDHAHFSKTFKNYFGCSPSDILEMETKHFKIADEINKSSRRHGSIKQWLRSL